MISWQIFSLNLSEVLELNIYVASLVPMTYMLQLEGECCEYCKYLY